MNNLTLHVKSHSIIAYPRAHVINLLLDRNGENFIEFDDFATTSQNAGSLLTSTHLFLFSLTCGTNFPNVLSPILPSRVSRQMFTTTSCHPPFIVMISSTPKWPHSQALPGYCDFPLPLISLYLLVLFVCSFPVPSPTLPFLLLRFNLCAAHSPPSVLLPLISLSFLLCC